MQPTLGVESRRETLEPRVCHRHYPQVNKMNPLTGICGSCAISYDIDPSPGATGRGACGGRERHEFLEEDAEATHVRFFRVYHIGRV